MARTVITSLVIDPTVLFLPEGEVREWVKKVNGEVKSAVKMKAPPTRSMAKHPSTATGKLRRSITARLDPPTRRVATAIVSVGNAETPYAAYVLGGTAYQGMRYIYSREGWFHKAEVDHQMSLVSRNRHASPYWFMRLKPNKVRRLRVHGQRANPFLTDGYNEVARHHAALGEMRGPFIFSRLS